MDRTKKKSLVVKFVCLLLSFVLWLYVSNVENPTRNSEMKGVSVELVNEDVLSESNLYITGDTNFTVNLKLEGAANDIYSLHKSDFKLRADLGEYALKKGENNIPVEVVSSPSGVTIKNSALLKIKVNLEEGTEKTVKVYSKVVTSYRNGVSQKAISVSPSVVKVSGPESLVNTLSSVAMKGQISDISKNISQNFNLVAVDSNGNEVNGVKLSQEKGELTIEVGKEKEVKINPIYANKLSDDLTLQDFSLSQQTVKIVGDTSVINSIQQIDTQPIDLSTIKESGDINVKLNLPNGVSLASGSGNITGHIDVKKNGDSKEVTNTTDEVTSKKIDGIKVNITGKEDNSKLNFDVDNVTVEVSGKESDLNGITADNIAASVSVSDIKEAGEYEEPVNISITNSNSPVTIKTKPDKVKVTVK
ncbi:YbbR domain-containing protein [Clostridium sp. DSM 8431]|uniref:CdaR family protein n=1 Tax=Clostridium sp. DSM 8431 TaxID=1761781 RepID=UPI0008DFEA05|nr:CdaR family protein [Clostridium sp. DSM 8431]SFU30333.1 YbbR domain-containing protein [Clostridium sp. DSM 8431]